MTGPYFRHSSWPPFHYRGTEFTLNHLDEFTLGITDEQGAPRLIAVTFEDHCFTKKPERDDPELVYSGSTRRSGQFCFERYANSLWLPNHIKTMTTGIVWNVEDTLLAYLPIVDGHGTERIYRVIFGLHRVKGLPVDLHLRVDTAYLAAGTPLATYGSIRFPKLVTIVMRNRKVVKNFDRRRKRPRIN